MKRILTSLVLLLGLAIGPAASGQELFNIATIQGPKEGVAAVAISPDGAMLAIAGKNKTVTLYHATVGRAHGTLDVKTQVVGLTFSADGKVLATRDSDDHVRLWDVATGADTARRLAARGSDGKSFPFLGGKLEPGVLAITGDCNLTLAHVASGVIAGKDGMMGTYWNEIRLLDVSTATRRTLLRAETPEAIPGAYASFLPLAFSPDGKLLIVGVTRSGDGAYRIAIVDLATRKQQPIDAGRDTLAFAFTSDGKTLATVQMENTGRGASPEDRRSPFVPVLMLWDVATGKSRSRQTAIPSGVVAIAPDSTTLVTVDAKHAVQVHVPHKGWRCGTADEAARQEATNRLERLKGMKAAIADLEKGILKVRELDPQIGLIPRPASRDAWIKLAKQQYGIEVVDENTLPIREEVAGYNGVMLLEIDRRFGRDVLDKLHDKVRAEHGDGK